ncbi:MAG: YfhO family protein [Anaerolineales bacterium]
MSKRISKFRISPSFLVLISPFVLLSPVWLTGRALYWGTPSTQFIPWWWQAWLTLKAGELPLWNPMVGMGAPLLANYQSALLYPPTWIYFILAAIGGMPLMAWGQALLVAAHLAWAGWGMVMLLRRLSVGEMGQTIGGLAFSLSGYLVARAHFLSINASVSWLPWILLATYELATDKQLNQRVLLKASLFFGLQWLAGHAQISWYTLLLAAAWFVFWSVKAGKRTLRNVAPLSLVLIFALALSLGQLLPTAEYLANSQRAVSLDPEEAMAYSFWPWRFLTLVAPNLFGNPAHGDYWGYANYWEDAIYVGLLTVLLSIGALLSLKRLNDRRPLKLFLLGVIVVSFLLALGPRLPFFPWLFSNVPTFDFFQAPTRFMVWAVFALALLVGLAVELWRRPVGRWLYWSRLGVAGAAAIVIGSAIAAAVKSAGETQIDDTFFGASATAGIIALGIAILNILAPTKDISKRVGWTWTVCGLLACDLVFSGWGLNPGTSLDFYREHLGNESSMRADLGRIYIPAEDEYALKFDVLFRFDDFKTESAHLVRETFLPNTSSLAVIPSANNFDPLTPNRYQRWIDTLENADNDLREALFSQMGLSYIEQINSLDPLEFEFVPTSGSPRERWVNCAFAVKNQDEAFGLLAADTLNLEKVVIIESDVRGGGPICGSAEDGSVALIESTANRVSLLVEAPGGGWLVLADAWYPGWRAFSNGEELTLYPANGTFRAVKLNPGQEQIDFVFRPASFYVGLAVSLLSWLLWTIFWMRSAVSGKELNNLKRDSVFS